MARDMDFRRKPTESTPSSRVGQLPPVKHGRPANITTSPGGQRLSHRRSPQTVLYLVIVGLAFAAIGTYYWSTQPPMSSSPPATNDEKKTAGQTTAQSNGLNAVTKSGQPIVQIYQGGAPEATVSQVIGTLREKGYSVENLGNSQFEYDKTYIWYTKTYADKAQTIGQLLSDRVISYRESQSAGVFDILIYLGKQ